MSAGGGGVQRRPLLGVGGVRVAAMRDQQLHHLLAVVDAALQESGKEEENVTSSARTDSGYGLRIMEALLSSYRIWHIRFDTWLS